MFIVLDTVMTCYLVFASKYMKKVLKEENNETNLKQH